MLVVGGDNRGVMEDGSNLAPTTDDDDGVVAMVGSSLQKYGDSPLTEANSLPPLELTARIDKDTKKVMVDVKTQTQIVFFT